MPWIGLHKVWRQASGSLTRASESLADWTDKKLPGKGINPDQGTLAVIDADHSKSHTPKTAVALLNKASMGYKTWTNQAICTLGGTFIICADAYKGEVKLRLKEKEKPEPRMKSGTSLKRPG